MLIGQVKYVLKNQRTAEVYLHLSRHISIIRRIMHVKDQTAAVYTKNYLSTSKLSNMHNPQVEAKESTSNRSIYLQESYTYIHIYIYIYKHI
uniref:Uncharacterized protein n=1 Tax=Arundo donax TaxID=35708 RepID=A0A0A9GJJ0_ARUDO